MSLIQHVGRGRPFISSLLSHFRLQFARGIVAPVIASASNSRCTIHHIRPVAAKNQITGFLVDGLSSSDVRHQRRHCHNDGAASRISTEPPLPPLPIEVFSRTVTIPPAVVDCLTSGVRGNGSGSSIVGQRSFNAVWLRENCRCPRCHNATTEQRAVVFHRFGPEAFDPMSIVATEDRRLEVLWADGHVSSYQLDSLESLANPTTSTGGTEASVMTPASSGRYGRRLWDATRMADVEARLERVDYRDLVDATASLRTTTTGNGASVPDEGTEKSPSALKALLGNLLRHGFTFVDNVPADLKSTMAAATTICPPLRTFYGDTWTFGTIDRSASAAPDNDSTHREYPIDMEFSDTAYTNIGIGVHNDGTYWTIPPGVQVFHCIQRDDTGEGGDTLLVDGFDAAERLRKADRASFDLLTRVRLDQQYIEPGKFRYGSSETVLRTFQDGTGDLEWVRYNPYDRAPTVPSLPTPTGKSLLPEIYAALAALGRLVEDPSAAIRFQLSPGRVLLVDNWRILHGRTAFTGRRVVCGCYLPRDDWISRAQSLGLLSPSAPA